MPTKKPLTTLSRRYLIAAAAAAALQVPAASAIPINITSIVGTWTDANAAPAPGNVTGIGTNTISWGQAATEAGQSNYVFDPAATPIENVLPDSPFGLGEFTHNNFPIFAPSLTSAELTVNIGFDILDEGVVIGNKDITSVFDFTHLESTNDADPCADGNPNGTPPNQNGCADRVTFETSNISESFELGGIEYVFSLVGFCSTCPAPGGEPSLVDEFWTTENETNTAVLVAEYTAKEVSLPGVAWLFMTGLAGATAARRRASRTANS